MEDKPGKNLTTENTEYTEKRFKYAMSCDAMHRADLNESYLSVLNSFRVFRVFRG